MIVAPSVSGLTNDDIWEYDQRACKNSQREADRENWWVCDESNSAEPLMSLADDQHSAWSSTHGCGGSLEMSGGSAVAASWTET